MGIYAITGGASGIGAGIVDRLQQDGHQVIVVDLHNADIEADLSSDQGRQQAIAGIKALAPDGLDGFIPCAGVGVNVKPVSLISRINYFGALATIEGLKDQVAKRHGAMVLISSISATMSQNEAYVEALLAGNEEQAVALIDELAEGNEAYAGGKRALTRWMRQHSRDYLAAGVRLNAIAPGYIATPLNEKIETDPSLRKINQAFAASIPVGRSGQPEDIAHATAFLLDPNSSFIAGTVLFLDGGHDALLRPNDF
ncbi:MAG: SDR family oxidoreductase [Pseudomonadota bacterium]|nr:SDR family oxidoreductase [Pseudomonadota bacterium]